MKTKLLTQLLLGAIIDFTWIHNDPSNEVVSFKLYKGSTIDKMSAIALIPKVGTGPFKYAYEFKNKTPQYFGVSAKNKAGLESGIQKYQDNGKPLLIDKPSLPAAFNVSLGQN